MQKPILDAKNDAKNIVICADGTGFDETTPSNANRLCDHLLDLRDCTKQVKGYDPGVGTMPESKRDKPTHKHEKDDATRSCLIEIDGPAKVGRLSQLMGLAVGEGLEDNVKQIYKALITRYNPGDNIYLFGFSRGAFTVRVVAGLINRVGLLRPENADRISEAYKLYEPHYEELSCCERQKHKEDVEKFRAAYSRPGDQRIHFLGIWDTVKSYGYFNPKSLPHTRHNPMVDTVRHALSLDEHRSFFAPTTWGGTDADATGRRGVPCSCQPVAQSTQGNDDNSKRQDVQEVWFPGVHSDVGAGFEALIWMVNDAIKHGLLIDSQACHSVFDRKSQSGKPHSEFRDELELCKLSGLGWWISEFLPRRELNNFRMPPTREFRLGPSGRRDVMQSKRDGKILIHVSAKTAYGGTDTPWSKVDPCTITWVDWDGNLNEDRKACSNGDQDAGLD